MTCLPIVERELRVAARKSGPRKFRFLGALVLMVVWFLLVVGSRGSIRPAELGRNLFATLSSMAFAISLLAGAFLTADYLSEEKREGTIGLLFLTDLKGYDVVLGKLAVTSLSSFYGLLAIFPILAMPVLLGGVTGLQFARVMTALMGTLLFSLATGLVISAISREARQAMVATLGAILLVSLFIPFICEMVDAVLRFPLMEPVRLLSPISAFSFAFDSHYHLRRGPRQFWMALGVLSGVSFGLLVLAAQILPRAWQEKRRSPVVAGRRMSLATIRFGDGRARSSLRVKLLARNPFYWLTCRDRLPYFLVCLFFGVLIPIWLCLLAGTFSQSMRTKMSAYNYILLITIGTHVLFKCLVTVEAARRLSDDRQSGALEAILVTPLSQEQIVTGQRRALWRHFRMPLIFLTLANICVLERMLFGLPGASRETDIYGVICFGGILMLFMDFVALGWGGMWTALAARKYYRAVLGTLIRVMVVPWLLLLMFGFLASGGRGLSSGDVTTFFVIWFVVGIGNDLVVIIWAKTRLETRFRLVACGVGRAFAALPIGSQKHSLNP